jgi:hypothetical protein
MKKLFSLFSFVIFMLCISSNAANAQNKIIGEKSTGIIGEDGIKAQTARMKNEISAYYTEYLRKQAAAESAANDLRKKLENAMKELEAKDRMGNFEIQRLMSQYNQAETLSSQIHKKIADTKNAVVSKL